MNELLTPEEMYDKLLDLASQRLNPREFAETFVLVVGAILEDAFAEHLRRDHGGGQLPTPGRLP